MSTTRELGDVVAYDAVYLKDCAEVLLAASTRPSERRRPGCDAFHVVEGAEIPPVGRPAW